MDAFGMLGFVFGMTGMSMAVVAMTSASAANGRLTKLQERVDSLESDEASVLE